MKVVILQEVLVQEFLNMSIPMVPKPMIKVGEYPLIQHIMNIYSYYNFRNFYIALGYRGNYIKNYFVNYNNINSDISVNLKNGIVKKLQKPSLDWKINLINTGVNSMTGGGLKKLKKFIGKKSFFLLMVTDYQISI